ncbi:NAD(P)H-binding protein [Phytoactinopolyspora limicola]|uniref:NmrA family NAD(P)-binding protein n=1 Tax=Phytoactinopolyspora limicola TaxID=2715536 RepID=UPI00140A624F|nr:NAD(P)H-binding protein [Phytoactinopolyspora limicola]
MTIAVTTPTGNVGAHLLRLLVQAGVRPRALLRDPSKLGPDVADQVEAVKFDAWDAGSVIEATSGVSALYWVSPTAMDRDPLAAHAMAARHVRAAVEQNRIDRVVFQSSVGAEKRHGVGEIDGLAATEVELDSTGASVTHLRCGYFFTNLLMEIESIRGGVFATAMDLDRRLPWVAPQDIAAVAAGRLLSSAWTGRHVQAVHGPEDLSFRQVAEQLSASLGHSVVPQQLTDQDVRTALGDLGLPAPQIEALVQMTAGIRDDFTPEDPRGYQTTTPTTLAAWAATHLG